MRQFYSILLYLLMPLVLARLLWRSLKVPDYRRRISERFGWFKPPDTWGGLWIHAVSVGEVRAAVPLVDRLLESHPDLPITVTTTTPTGSMHLLQQLRGRVFHVYFPYDLPIAVRAFLRRTKPRVLLMVETEIWPNLLCECHRGGVFTLLANARLSASSARAYRRFGRFSRNTFSNIDLVAAQTEGDAVRYSGLGVSEDRVVVTGNVKFDRQYPAHLIEQVRRLKNAWGERPVWVAASTHAGEDQRVLNAHKSVLMQFPDALLVLVPRHPEQFESAVALCHREQLKVARRSLGDPAAGHVQVYVGDTMGDLPVLLGAADVAFIGGSLVKTGGHNMLEASAQGVPVCFGPHVFNFAAISEMLLAQGAARQVSDASGLATCVCDWFGDPVLRLKAGEKGREVVAQHSGALDRLAALIPLELQ